LQCDCPVYRSTPNVCQHALAAAEDLCILPDYLQWLRKTKKTLNLSQLIADGVPNNTGQKPTSRCKGGPKWKQPLVNDAENSAREISSKKLSTFVSSEAHNSDMSIPVSSSFMGCNLSTSVGAYNCSIPTTTQSYSMSHQGYGMPGIPPIYSSYPTTGFTLHLPCMQIHRYAVKLQFLTN